MFKSLTRKRVFDVEVVLEFEEMRYICTVYYKINLFLLIFTFKSWSTAYSASAFSKFFVCGVLLSSFIVCIIALLLPAIINNLDHHAFYLSHFQDLNITLFPTFIPSQMKVSFLSSFSHYHLHESSLALNLTCKFRKLDRSFLTQRKFWEVINCAEI